MWIKQLEVKNCRLLEDVSIELSPMLNIIIGDNASGKTSLLESLHLLSNGRSFRTPNISSVISHQKQSVLVSAKIALDSTSFQIGIEKSPSKTKIRIDKKDIFSQAELSRHLPLTIIHPDSIQLITGAPSNRRAFIDWISFYSFPDFIEKWKAYKHVLKQRNHCLKNSKHRYALQKWTNELAALQPDIIQYRLSATNKLLPLFKETASKLLKGIEVDIRLNTGFPADIDVDEASLFSFYQSKLEHDIKCQRTTSGAHKADVKIMINSTAADQVASRGQLKLLSIALLLSQSATIKNSKQEKGILLFDDFSAELDTKNQKNLIKYLIGLEQQIILTTTKKELQPSLSKSKMFHVKHGDINLLE